MASWPDLKAVRSFLRQDPDAAQDALIDAARTAAIDYGQQRLGRDLLTGELRYPTDTTTLPDACYQACLIHASRLYRRRDSLDGTVWFGDGAGRIASRDPDVREMYDVYAPVVFG